MFAPTLASFTLLLAFVASHATAQSLWEGTTYGMSLQEVKALFPTAAPPGNPVSIEDGSEELLRLRTAKFLGRPFGASFFFRNGRLSQVNISLQGLSSKNDVATVFDTVTSALQAKYGQPVNLERRNAPLVPQGPSENYVNARWNVGLTDIDLLASHSGATDPILIISFQVVDEEMFSSPIVVSTSKFFLLIAVGCRGEKTFCESAFFRFITFEAEDAGRQPGDESLPSRRLGRRSRAGFLIC